MNSQKTQAIASKLKDAAESLNMVMDYLDGESRPVEENQESMLIMAHCIRGRIEMFISTMSLIRDCIGLQADELLALSEAGDAA